MGATIVVAGADQKMVSEVVEPLAQEGYQFVLVTTDELVSEVGEVKRCFSLEEVAVVAVGCLLKRERCVLLKGQIQTATLLKEVLKKKHGLRKSKILSQVTQIDLLAEHRQFLLTDPALNIAPSVTDKIGICLNAMEVADKLGWPKGKVALLSSVEVLNLKIPSAVAAAEVAQYFQRHESGVIVEGPLSLDVAMDPKAAREKNYRGLIQGDATILVAPAIDAANMLYKTFAHFTKSRVCGVLVGAAVPIALTSRSDSGAAKINAIKMAEQLIDEEGRKNGNTGFSHQSRVNINKNRLV